MTAGAVFIGSGSHAAPTASQGVPAALERRVRLAFLPTPLARLDRLAEHLGRPAGSILIKRDDLTGFPAGGNKIRKLEYVCREAIDSGCDTIVTGGAAQSNHGRQTAAACAQLGLKCVLVLADHKPARLSGNTILAALCGAELRWIGPEPDLESAIRAEADELRRSGVRAYSTPIGASVPVGALGYVRCALELREQDDSFDLVALGSGSGGTQSGLAVGLGTHDRVLGLALGDAQYISARVEKLALQTAELIGRPRPAGACRLFGDRLTTVHRPPSDETLQAILLLGRLEGVALDPVYTGPAMAGLIAACRNGAIARTEKVVFIHTGGVPGLLADPVLDWIGPHAAAGAASGDEPRNAAPA